MGIQISVSIAKVVTRLFIHFSLPFLSFCFFPSLLASFFPLLLPLGLLLALQIYHSHFFFPFSFVFYLVRQRLGRKRVTSRPASPLLKCAPDSEEQRFKSRWMCMVCLHISHRYFLTVPQS